MKRKFKYKIKKNNRILTYIILFTLSFTSTLKLILNSSVETKEYLLSGLINETTLNESVLFEKLSESLASPKYIIYNGLNKIVDKNNLSVFSNIEEDYFDYRESKSEYIEDPEIEVITKEPVVYIYNTHQLEEYSLETLYDYSVKPNVMISSYILREKLKNNGVSSVVETNNMKKYLSDNNMSYNKSYHASEYFAREMQKKYPTIEYLIDIHRDSAKYDKTYYEQDGKSYARILFVVGLEHTTASNNVGFAEELNEIIKRDYPGLSRGVLKKTGPAVNGVYNQNLSGKSVLIEVGGVDNKIEEVYNTMSVISDALTEYIKGDL